MNTEQVKKTYEIFRVKHEAMSSIRFTAEVYGVPAWDVAEALGLSDYFIKRSMH